MGTVRYLALAAALLAAAASGAEQPIRGLEIAFEVAAKSSGHDTIHLRARDPAPALVLSGDPVRLGAMLTVAVSGSGTDHQTVALPAIRSVKGSAGWRVRRRRAAVGQGAFVYRDPKRQLGPVTFFRLARGARAMRLDLRMGGPTVTLRPPDPGTAGGLVVTLPPGDPYCVAFGGTAGGPVRANTATRFAMGRGERAACPDTVARTSFVTFESEQVRPLALSPDGRRLFVVNTPDGRLETFTVTESGDLEPEASVPVGLEPVAVAPRTDSEVWVVNHVSDSISVVDLAGTPHVVRTILTCDEPRDIVFAGGRAFVTTARRGQNCLASDGHPIDPALTTAGVPRALVQVFDATASDDSLGGTPVAVVELFGDTPRALAVSPGGDTVYAAVLRSGNRTTTVHEQAVCDGGSAARPCLVGGLPVPGGLPLPSPVDCHRVPEPETGLIVQYDSASGAWLDAVGRDWRNAVRFTLPDRDVFAIDAMADPPSVRRAWSDVGTVIFNLVANPITGRLYASNTEANNLTQFEGDRSGSCVSSTVRGHLHEARITVIDGDTVTPRHLNPHLEPYEIPPSVGDKARSLATPLGMATDGVVLWVAAFGSGTVARVDVARLEDGSFAPDAADHVAVSGGGPSGLVLRGDRLYVVTRFDDAVSVIDTTARREIAHLLLHDPEPPTAVAGRRFLYDAVETSNNGEASCAACHVFGDLDGLAWNLGNPDGAVVPNPNPFEVADPSGDTAFRPMKGPMTTQSLHGMANHGPLHWRGDRFGPAPHDEMAAFEQFNGAFVSLLGRSAPLSAEQMHAFAEFALQITYPPNPIRNLDDTLTPAQADGRMIYQGLVSDGVRTCDGCHVLDRAAGFFGTDGDSSFDREPQDFKIPHLRNAYQKVGMFGMPPVPTVRAADGAFMGEQVRGFGFLHDGSIDTIARFLSTTVFSLSSEQARDVEAFVLAFDSNLAPIVGQQVTLTPTNAAAAGPRIDLLLAAGAAPVAACDVVVHGILDGVPRGWVRLPSGRFRSDRKADPDLTDGDLRAQAGVAEQERTWTCVPPGSGVRLGIDRDEDGCLDGDDPEPEDRTAGCAD